MSDDSTSVNPADGVWLVYERHEQTGDTFPVAVFPDAQSAVLYAMEPQWLVTFWPYGAAMGNL